MPIRSTYVTTLPVPCGIRWANRLVVLVVHCSVGLSAEESGCSAMNAHCQKTSNVQISVVLSCRIWSPTKWPPPPGTKEATKLVPPGTNLIAEFSPL